MLYTLFDNSADKQLFITLIMLVLNIIIFHQRTNTQLICDGKYADLTMFLHIFDLTLNMKYFLLQNLFQNYLLIYLILLHNIIA